MHLIALDIDKSVQINESITYYLNPDYVYVPCQKKNILIKQNEPVYMGMPISKESTSPVSGKVFGIKPLYLLDKSHNFVVIANDFREMSKTTKARKKLKSSQDLLTILENNKETELLNLFKSSKTFSNIVIKTIDDNPYVYNKVFLLKENMEDILDILDQISLLYQSINNLIVIKNTDAYIIDSVLKLLGTYPKTKLTLVNPEYPISRTDILQEKLNLKSNTLYLDVFDLIKIKHLLNNELDTKQIITISGNAIKESKVLIIKSNILLSDIIDRFIEIKESVYEIIINGLMTGFKIKDARVFVITKEVKSINIMKKNHHKSKECINCGECIKICPFKVNPLTLKNKDKCINCGLCTYICPSYINLREILEKR